MGDKDYTDMVPPSQNGASARSAEGQGTSYEDDQEFENLGPSEDDKPEVAARKRELLTKLYELKNKNPGVVSR